MSDFINIPSFLTNGFNAFPVIMASCGGYYECGSCEVVCTGCEGNEGCGSCEDCLGCQSICQNECQTSCQKGTICQTTAEACGDCEVVCMVCMGCETGQGYPQLPLPTLNTGATVKTPNSIEITINFMADAYRYHARINGGNEQSSTSRTFTFTGLQPNTQYLIEIKVGGVGYADSDWNSYYATTSGSWEWFFPKTAGIDFNVTREEWIAFIERINEIRILNGLPVYSFTTSTDYIAQGKDFYAWIFLQVVNAINDIGSGISTELLGVKSGDDIYAWYFENLKTALNNAV